MGALVLVLLMLGAFGVHRAACEAVVAVVSECCDVADESAVVELFGDCLIPVWVSSCDLHGVLASSCAFVHRLSVLFSLLSFVFVAEVVDLVDEVAGLVIVDDGESFAGVDPDHRFRDAV